MGESSYVVDRGVLQCQRGSRNARAVLVGAVVGGRAVLVLAAVLVRKRTVFVPVVALRTLRVGEGLGARLVVHLPVAERAEHRLRLHGGDGEDEREGDQAAKHRIRVGAGG